MKINSHTRSRKTSRSHENDEDTQTDTRFVTIKFQSFDIIQVLCTSVHCSRIHNESKQQDSTSPHYESSKFSKEKKKSTRRITDQIF